MAEFIFPIDFMVLNIRMEANPESHILVILGCPFSATSNALTNYRNDMMECHLVI